jgi:hypothetical protein
VRVVQESGSIPEFERETLRDLVHHVCQPLTTLHCALESALADKPKSDFRDISLALEQAQRIAETVRQIRECLDAEPEHIGAAAAR